MTALIRDLFEGTMMLKKVQYSPSSHGKQIFEKGTSTEEQCLIQSSGSDPLKAVMSLAPELNIQTEMENNLYVSRGEVHDQSFIESDADEETAKKKLAIRVLDRYSTFR